MSKMQHSPEPWRLVSTSTHPHHQILSGNRLITSLVDYHDSQDRADGKRFVNCVNACAGINPEAVPDLLRACEAVANWRERNLTDAVQMCAAAAAKAKYE